MSYDDVLWFPMMCSYVSDADNGDDDEFPIMISWDVLWWFPMISFFMMMIDSFVCWWLCGVSYADEADASYGDDDDDVMWWWWCVHMMPMMMLIS